MLRGLGVSAQARRIRTSLLFSVAGISSFLPLSRNEANRGARMQGLGKGGALSPVRIVRATAEEVHRVYYSTNREISPVAEI